MALGVTAYRNGFLSMYNLKLNDPQKGILLKPLEDHLLLITISPFNETVKGIKTLRSMKMSIMVDMETFLPK